MVKTCTRVFICLLIILCFIFINGCGTYENKEQLNKEEKAIKIGVLLYRYDDDFINSLKGVMINEVEKIKELSYGDLKVTFFDGKNQKDIQYKQICRCIEEEYDVLAINLVDRSDAARVIDKAKDADIPIVFFNREPVQVDMARWNKIYYVGSKAEESGNLQGEVIVDYWKKHPEADKNHDGIIQYVMLQGQLEHQDTILRSKYVIQTIEEQNINVEEIARNTANWQRLEASDKMKGWLDVFGEQIELVISNNDAMALGAVEVIKASKLNSNIPVVGIDAIDSAVEALHNDDMIGTVCNDSEIQGEVIIKMTYYLSKHMIVSDLFENMEDGVYYWVPYSKVDSLLGGPLDGKI